MRFWWLAGFAAALALVAVAGADPGRSVEVEEVVGEKEDRLRVRREDKTPRPPPSQPCPGCYSPLSKPGSPATVRRQVEKQQRPRVRSKPKPTWRPGVLTSLSKGEDRLRVRREDKKRRPPPSKPCPGCYSPLSKPGTPARARRQVEKRQRPRIRPTWRPGSLTLLRPAKDPEIRTRREDERRPRPRPRPRPNPSENLPYNPGFMSILSSHVESPHVVVIDPRPTVSVRWLDYPASVATSQEEPAGEGILSPRTRREDERPPAMKQKGRAGLYCAGCYSSLTLWGRPAPVSEEANRGSSRD